MLPFILTIVFMIMGLYAYKKYEANAAAAAAVAASKQIVAPRPVMPTCLDEGNYCENRGTD